MIKFDLHIHSIASKYKESSDIVDNSTVKNAELLEYEDENINVLDIVAQNMDGGKSAIEKRMMVYGKEN